MSSLACSRLRGGHGHARGGRWMTLYYDMQARQISHSFLTSAEGHELQTVTIAMLFDLLENRKTRGWPKWKRYVDRQREYREQIREYNRNCLRAPMEKQREVLIEEAAWCSS